MSITVGTYNIEWFENQFNPDNSLKTLNPSDANESKLIDQRKALKKILQTLQVDLLAIIEAPNNAAKGAESTVQKLKNFITYIEMPAYDVAYGYTSAGQQEIAAIYNKDKLTIVHKPGGSKTSKSNPRFDSEFYCDTDDDEIMEVYEMYRPPLELEVIIKSSNKKFMFIAAHTKSKGIFTAMDMIKWDQENLKHRKKLYAECTWIRKRVDEFLDKGLSTIVVGDINDGPGMDYYEQRFGKSAVEIIMGTIYNPSRILRNYIGMPTWTGTGWSPSSTAFTDRMTGSKIYTLIDHILLSQDIPCSVDKIKIWNPYELNQAKSLIDDLLAASDHFPVTAEVF